MRPAPSLNYNIFRDYDIRAVADRDLTDEITSLIARAFASQLRARNFRSVVVGRDNRVSSARIVNALINGLLSSGCDVLFLDQVTTPMLCFATGHLAADAGAMVTGSHNPADYNGIKLQIGSSPLHGDQLKAMIRLIEEREFCSGLGNFRCCDIVADYKRLVKGDISLGRRITVVVDGGNGNAGPIAFDLLSEIGCEVISLYCTSDGSFPNHHPDPAVHSNMRDLVYEVVRRRADLGVAFDGDGNRIGVVAENGSIVPSDILLAILARELLAKPAGAKVVCDVKASQSLIEDVTNHGGVIVISKTGYPFILDTMFRQNAVLAGELTGHICYNKGALSYGDAVYVACRLCQLLSHTDIALSRSVLDIPRYVTSPEYRIPCRDDEKGRIVSVVADSLRTKYECNCIDGVRVYFDQSSWALIRASNTGPLLSIRFEAKTEQRLKEIKGIVGDLLRAAGYLGRPLFE